MKNVVIVIEGYWLCAFMHVGSGHNLESSLT